MTPPAQTIGFRRWAPVVAGALGCAAVSLSFSVPLMRFDPNIYDEALIALGAEQVLKGHWPLVDFYVPYPPGAFFALAGLFAVTGPGLLAERALSVGLVALTMGIAFVLVCTGQVAGSGRSVRPWVGMLPIGIAGLALSATWVTPEVAGGLALLMVAGLCLARGLLNGSTMWAVATGASLGCAALWRADHALYGAFAAWLTWLLLAPLPERGRGRLFARLRGACAMALAAIAVCGPVLFCFVVLGGRRAFNGLFVWPISGTWHATLPWPALFGAVDWAAARQRGVLFTLCEGLKDWPFYFPFVMLAAGAWQLASKRGRVSPTAGVRLWLVLLALGFSVYAMGRSDFTHVFPLVVVTLCLAGAFLLTELSKSGGGRNRAGLAIVVLALGGLVPTPLWNFFERQKTARVPMPFARARGMLQSAGEIVETSALIRALNEGEGEAARATFSGTRRHDVFLPNDSMLYFLSERDPGTYYWCLDSGVTTTEKVQREMVEELAASKVRRVVLWDSFEVADAHPVPGATVLDQRLSEAFPVRTRVGHYAVWARSPAPPTAPPRGPDEP